MPTVGLDERAALANNNKADLFVSLHANASVRRVGSRRRGLLPQPRGVRRRRRSAWRKARRRRFRSSAAARATSRSSCGRWRRRATSRQSAALAQASRSGAARARADEPARDSAGARSACSSARTCRRCSSRWASSRTRTRSSSSRPTPFQAVARPGARRQHHPLPRQTGQPATRGRRGRTRAPGRRPPTLMSRRMLVIGAIAMLAIAGGWWLTARFSSRLHLGSRRQPRRRPAGTTVARRRPQDHRDALLRVRGRHVARRRPARGAVRRDRARSGAADRRGAARGGAGVRSSPPIPAGTTLRALYLTERGDAFVDLSAGCQDQTHRRRARRALHGLRDRQRAHDEPAGDHARADPRRRQGGRHARRTRRSPTSAAEEPEMGQDGEGRYMTRSDGRTPGDLRPTRLTPGFLAARRRIGADRGRPHARHLHGERRGSRAAVPAQHRQGLGHGGVRHAAARHDHAHAARGDGRQGRRAHAGDPAADRPVAALGDEACRSSASGRSGSTAT